MGGGGKHKRAADYTNFSNDLFRPLPENKVEDDSIKEVKRDDYTNFPEPFRPLPENKEEEKVIIDAKRLADAKNEEKRSNSMWELNRMGGGGKHKRAADYTNFSNDLFRPLPENKVEEDSIEEVKRDSEEKRSAQGEFHRAVVFKPSGKRSDECATNSPTVEINDSLLEKCCNIWFPNPFSVERSGRVKDIIVFRACREHLLHPDKL